MTGRDKYPHLIRAGDIEEREATFSHPFNSKSEITGTHLSKMAGLERSGVSLVRIAPGKESFAYHMHHREEEWIYVLSGSGVALVDDEEYQLEAGDFIAFPTPSAVHNMSNPFDSDLVYLMGGENLEHEIADFPALDKRMVRLGESVQVYRLSDGKSWLDENQDD